MGEKIIEPYGYGSNTLCYSEVSECVEMSECCIKNNALNFQARHKRERINGSGNNGKNLKIFVV